MKKIHLIFMLALLGLVLSSCEKKEDEDDNNDSSNYTETEPNNSFSQASGISLGESYDCEISPSQDKDYFKITASGEITVSVTGDSNLDVRVHFFDEAEVDIFGDDAGQKGGTLTHTVTASEYDGFFYFRVEDSYGNYTGSYTIVAE